jgi:hypothetical protein
MKFINYICLFVAIYSFHQTAFGVEVKLPIYVDGVKEDTSALQGEYFVYEVRGRLDEMIGTIKRQEKNDKIEHLMSNLWWAYKNKDKNLFQSLFSQKAKYELQKIPQSTFDIRFDQFSKVTAPIIEFYFEHSNGYVLKWKDKSSDLSEVLYVQRDKENYLFSSLKLTSEDKRFHNIATFLSYKKFNFSKAHLTKLPSNDDLTVNIKSKNTYITFLKKNGQRWERRLFLKNNSINQYLLDDLDPSIEVVRIEFKQGLFEPNIQHEILVIESNFPLSFLPLSFTDEPQVKLKLTE